MWRTQRGWGCSRENLLEGRLGGVVGTLELSPRHRYWEGADSLG